MISNRGKKITNRGIDYKSGQEGLQTGAGVSNCGRDFKSVQNNAILLLSKNLGDCFMRLYWLYYWNVSLITHIHNFYVIPKFSKRTIYDNLIRQFHLKQN